MPRLSWFLVMLFAAAAPLAAQNVFNVTNTSDTGAGSLRQAILDANATVNQSVTVPDEIRFNSGVTGTIAPATPLPVITEGVSIIGPGRALLTLSGGNTMRILESNTGHYLGVSRMTLANGRGDGDGGAILSRGFTVISDVEFDNCHAIGASSGTGPGVQGRGGAIFHAPLIAELWVTNALFDNCSAEGGNGTNGNGGDAFGGAIYLSNGTGRLSLSTIQNCLALGGDASVSGTGGVARGGGIYATSALDLDDFVVDNSDAAAGTTATAATGGNDASGGGIHANTNIDAVRLTVSVCTTTGGTPGAGGVGGDSYGGGITNENGTSILRLCEISGCTSSSPSGGSTYGAGLYIESDFTMEESQIDACVGNDLGGGLYFEGGGTVDIDRSTISNCTGVGIRAQSGTSFLIINSTISGNGNGSTTGGIWNGGAVMQISFSTITDNIGTTWGGVYRTGGTLSIIGSIIAGNTGASTTEDLDANGSMTIQNSVVGIQDQDAIAVNGSNGNQVGSTASPLSPNLGPLTNNGGPTPTHALLASSPAINMGGSTGAPTTDQRNAPRDQGVPDAGSYEFGATPPNTGGTAGGEGDSRCSTAEGTSLTWLALLGLIAAFAAAARLRKA